MRVCKASRRVCEGYRHLCEASRRVCKASRRVCEGFSHLCEASRRVCEASTHVCEVFSCVHVGYPAAFVIHVAVCVGHPAICVRDPSVRVRRPGVCVSTAGLVIQTPSNKLAKEQHMHIHPFTHSLTDHPLMCQRTGSGRHDCARFPVRMPNLACDPWHECKWHVTLAHSAHGMSHTKHADLLAMALVGSFSGLYAPYHRGTHLYNNGS